VEIDWITFALEIINFLVLVWILQHFFYRPILNVIAQRRAAIDKTVEDAKSRQSDAEHLEQQYRDRLAVWEQEKAGLRAQADADIAAEKNREMAALQDALARERKKQEARSQRQLEDQRDAMEREAIAQGARFTSALFSRLATPVLQNELLRLVLEDLPKHAGEIGREVNHGGTGGTVAVSVESAFPLDDADREKLLQALHAAVGHDCSPSFKVNPELQAGLRIGIGALVLRGNLHDELKSFSEAPRDAN